MENKKKAARILWITLAALAAVVVALVLLIRTEKRLLRVIAKAEKLLKIKKKPKTKPITVEF